MFCVNRKISVWVFYCCAERSSFSVVPESFESSVGKEASLQTSSGGWWILVRKDERDSTSASRILDTTNCSVTLQFVLQLKIPDLKFSLFICHRNCTLASAMC